MKGHVDDLNGQVEELQRNADELEEQAKQFDGLIHALEEVAGDNEDILKIVDDTNDIFSDMRRTMLENDRAQLLTVFYKCALKDHDDTMNKGEYDQFLGRLTQDQRAKFPSLEKFDGQIDLDEFTQLIENALGDVDDELAKKLAKEK